MGGNVFSKTHDAVRLNRTGLDMVANSIKAAVKNALWSIEPYDIPFYEEKASFGDLDIVAVAKPDVVMYELKSAGVQDISRNGNVVSFLTGIAGGHFQVDVICFPTQEQAKTAVNYFAYNDLGNLIGRLYHSIGFKYGHDGLSYVRRDGDYQVYTMPVSTDIHQMLSYVGLCPFKFFAGFKTLEEIFEYVASSPFYHPSIYLLENRNHTSRVRDRKRKTYMEFVKWSESHPKAGTEYTKPDKEKYLGTTLKYFGKIPDYTNLETQYRLKKICKQLLNGDIVGKLTGLTGKDLGAFMTDLRKVMPDELLILYTPRGIEDFVTVWHERKLNMDRLHLGH